MLRMYAKATAREDVPGLHHSQHTERTHSLYSLGETRVQVGFPSILSLSNPSRRMLVQLFAFSQLFGELDIDDDISPDLTDEGNRGDDGNSEKAPGEGDARESQDDAVNGLASTNGSHEMETDSDAKQKISTRAWAESVNYDPEKIFDKVSSLESLRTSSFLSLRMVFSCSSLTSTTFYKWSISGVSGALRLQSVGLTP